MSESKATNVFTDAAGRKWELRIPFSQKKPLADLGLDLCQPWDAVVLVAEWTETNQENLVQAAYNLGSPTQPGVSFDQFTQAIIGGEALWELSRCLASAVIDFFPRPAIRTALHAMLAGKTVCEAIDAMESESQSTSSAKSGSAPASLESSPTATPGVSCGGPQTALSAASGTGPQ